MDYMFKELLISTGIGFGLNYLSQSLFPADLIKGDPRWMYNLGIFYQGMISGF
jgi:hypothetical protein